MRGMIGFAMFLVILVVAIPVGVVIDLIERKGG